MSHPWPFGANRGARHAAPALRPAPPRRPRLAPRGLIFEGLESRVLLSGETGVPPPDPNELLAALTVAPVEQPAAAVGPTDAAGEQDRPSVRAFALVSASPDGGTVSGTADDDVLEGGAGDDTLDGGAGDDRYVFGGGWGEDTVTDTGSTDDADTLDFSAVTANLTFTIRLDTTRGVVVDVTDGTSTLTATGIEHLVGGEGDDRFVFEGTATLPGTIRAGGGDDTLDYSHYAGSAQIDLATGSATAVNGGAELSVLGVENVVAPAGAADGLTADTGRADNRLEGGAGKDTLRGGAGNDRYVFGDGWGQDTVTDTDGTADLLDFSAVSVDLTFGAGTVDNAPGWSVDDGLVLGDTLDASNVDVLIGGAGDDTYDGVNGGTDTVYRFVSDAGSDTPTWGSDVVIGGAGEDTLDFSAFDGTLTFEIRDVTAAELRSSGAPGLGVVVKDRDDNVVVAATGVENLIGGRGDNRFVIASGASLPGTIRGSFGGKNTLDYSTWTDPVEVDLSLASATAINGGIRGGVLNVQNAKGGTGNDRLIGNAFANELSGGDGDDTLIGGAGDDVLSGGLGADTYDGGDGSDTVSFADDEAVVVNLATDTAELQSGTVEESLPNVENVVGSAFGDTLTGDAGDNLFDGGTGDDTIDGGGGSDTISYRNTVGAVTVNLATGTAGVAATQISDEETDTLTSIENAIGRLVDIGNEGDRLTGNADGNRFVVAAGATATVDGGGGNDELVIVAGGGTLGQPAQPGQVAITIQGNTTPETVTYSNVESVSVQETTTAVAADGVQELGSGLQALAERVEQLESLAAFGLGIPLADPGGESFGALLGFGKVLRQLADDFDKRFRDADQTYLASNTAELREFFNDWSVDLRAALAGKADLEGTRDWLARTLSITDSLALDASGNVNELALNLRLTNARTTFMDLGESQFLNDAGVFVTRGQGFELTSGFDVDLTFGLENFAPAMQPSFFIDAGDRFKVTAFASLRDQLPVSLGEIASRIGFMGGTVGGAGSELRTLNAGAQAQLAGSGDTRLTRDELESAAFDVLAGATGLLEGNLPFATGGGFDDADAQLGDGGIGLGDGANFLAGQLAVSGLPGDSGDFTFATAAELLRMLGQLGDWFGALSTSDLLNLPIPFAGNTTLGDAIDFGRAFGEDMLRYLTQHDGLRLGSATAENGRLSDDPNDQTLVTFTLAIETSNGDQQPLTVSLRAGATALNSTVEDLRAQVEQALIDSADRASAAQRALAEQIEVAVSEGRIVFSPVAGSTLITGVSLPRIGNESLGFDGQHLVVPRSLLEKDLFDRDYVGTLGHDLELTLNVDGTPLTVDVARDASNDTLAALLDDINAAVAAAVAAGAPGKTVTAALIAGTEDKIGFTATDDADPARAVQALLTGVREPAVLVPDRLSLGVETATFPTAQLLAKQLENIINKLLGSNSPVKVHFDVPTREMSLDVHLSHHFDLASVPLDLGVDLGNFLSIDAATDLNLGADVSLAFTFGVNLFPHEELVVAPPVFQPNLPENGQLSGEASFGFTLFEQNFPADQRLSAGPLRVNEFAITVGGSTASVGWNAPTDGRLVDAKGDPSPDQRFFLRIGDPQGGGPVKFVSGVLLSHDTLDNLSPSHLADDLATAIRNALASNGFDGVTITIGAPTTTGFEISAGGAFAGRSIALVTAEEFRVATIPAVRVAADATNVSVDDLVADAQAAIDAALKNAGLGPVADPLLGLDGTVAINDLNNGGLPVVGELEVPKDGVLTRDVRFTVVVDGGTIVRGIVRAADTQTNATASDGPTAALARDVESAINAALDAAGAGSARIEVRAHPPLGEGSLTLPQSGAELTATSAVPENGVLDRDVLFSVAWGLGAPVEGAVRAQSTKGNASRSELAADVSSALNDALRRAAGANGGTIVVDTDADGRLVFKLIGSTQPVNLDFTKAPTRQLEFAARDANLELTFASPQVVASRTGNRISLTALPSLEKPDAGSPPLVVNRRIGVTIDDFDDPAYAELGLLSSPVPFDGRLTSDATFKVVVDDTPFDVTVAANATSTNLTVDDLISDINDALTAAFGSDRVQARRVSLAEAILTGWNRFELYTKDTSIQRISLPALADEPDNSAITQLGFSTEIEQSARVQTAEFFIRCAALDGKVTLSADGLTGSALVGFGGAGGLGIGVDFQGEGSIVGSAHLALVNPAEDPNVEGDEKRITLESLWKQIGDPSLELGDMVRADVDGIVDVKLLATPVLLGRTPLEPITVALNLNIADWLDSPPALDDASSPNGIAVSVTGLDLNVYDALSHLSFGDVVDALDQVLDFLVDLQGQDGALAKVLDRPLPLLNQSPNDLLVIADHFATLVDDVAANPARSLTMLEHTLENLLGLPDDFVTLSLDTEDGLALRVDLVFDTSVDASFGFDLDLRDLVALTEPGSPARTFLEGLTHFVGVSSTGDLSVGADGKVRLSLGIALGDGNGSAEALGFKDGATGTGTLTATGDAQTAADRLVDEDVAFDLKVGGETVRVSVSAGEQTRAPVEVSEDTRLSELDHAPKAGSNTLAVRLADGTEVEIDLDGLETVGDVVAELDAASGLTASFDADAHAIVLTDTTDADAKSQAGVYVTLTRIPEFAAVSFSLQVGLDAAPVPVSVPAATGVTRKQWLAQIEEAIRKALADAGEINPVADPTVAVAYNAIASGGQLTFQGTGDGFGARLKIFPGAVFSVSNVGDSDAATALGLVTRLASTAVDRDGDREIHGRELRTEEPADVGGFLADLQRGLDAALDGTGLPAVTASLLPPASGPGVGRVELTTTPGTAIEIHSIDDGLKPFLYNGPDGTAIRIGVHATGENLDFTAQVGPFGFFVEDGSAALDAFFSATLADTGDADGRTYFSDDFELATDYGGSASASLPLFFPDASTPVNDADNALKIAVPDLLSFLGVENPSGGFDRGAGSVTISTPDLTAFPTPTLIGMLSNPEFLIDGLDSVLSSVQDALDGQVFGIDLPLVGDKLAPAGQFIGDFRDDVLGYLSLKLRQGGLSPVTLVQETLYNIFADEHDGDPAAVEVLGFTPGAEARGVLQAGAVLTSGALARDAAFNVKVGRDDEVRVVVRAEDVGGDGAQDLVEALNDSLRGRGLDDRLTAGYANVAGGFVLTLTAARPSDVVRIDTAGAIPIDLFGVRVGGLGFLNDVAGPSGLGANGVVDVNDIVKSGFGLFDDFGQFDFLLGDRYVFNQPLDFDLGLPILELDLDAGVQVGIGWQFAFGFGVSQDDGFYFVADSDLTPSTAKELMVDIDVGLLGALGFTPGATAVADPAADRAVLTAAAELPSDGRLSRDLTFSVEVGGTLLADVTVTASATSGNTTRAELAADVEAALDAALAAHGLDPNLVTASLHVDGAGHETGLLELGASGAGTSLTIFDRATALGQLGFLALDVLDGGRGNTGLTLDDLEKRDYTSLHLEFAVDLRDPNADDDRLSFAEMSASSTSLSDILVADASGAAKVNLGLVVSFDAFGLDAAMLPAIGTDLLIDWSLGFSTAGGAKIGTPDVQFRDITLDLGSFITDFAGPFLDKLADVLSPLDFLLDRESGLLYQRLPVISDLAGETVTLLRLAELLDTNNKIVPFVQAVEQVYYLANLVSDAAQEARDNGGSILIKFGTVTLDDLGSVDSLQDSHPDTSGLDSNAVDAFNGGGGSSTQSTRNFTRTVTRPGPGSVTFDILQPGTIVNLLLGKPDVTLVTYTLPSFGFDFQYLQRFPIYPPLFATLRGAFSATIDLAFGFDTLGLSEFKTSRNPLDLLNGFFVDDLRDGVDVPELTLDGTIAAGASLDVGVASAGVEGGLNALIFFNLNDPNLDGRVRLNEMLGNLLINSYNPLAVFDTSGRFDAFLRAYVEVLFGVWSKSYEIGRVTLATFEVPFERIPVLATDTGNGVLELNVGTAAQDRIHGSLLDGDDTIVARYAEGSVYVSSPGVAEQRFVGVQKIVVDGGAGNDTIDLRGLANSGLEIEIHGGTGNDTLYGASGTASKIFGDEGDDRVFGGSAADEIDGGAGNDAIDGCGGGDTLAGGAGDDTIAGDTGDDTIDGGAGNDLLDGGAGDDAYVFANDWGDDRVEEQTTAGTGDGGHDTWDFGKVSTDLTVALGADPRLASIEDVEITPDGELRITATRHGLHSGDQVSLAGLELETASGTVTLRGSATVTVEAGDLDRFLVSLPSLPAGATPVANTGVLQTTRTALEIATLRSADENDPNAAIQVETAARHGLQSGDIVRLGGLDPVTGRAVVDSDRTYVVTVVDAHTFNLDDTRFASAPPALPGAFAQRTLGGSGLVESIEVAPDGVTVTAADNGLAAGDEIALFGFDDAAKINGKYVVKAVADDGDSFTLDTTALDGDALLAGGDRVVAGGVGVWQLDETRAATLGSSVTSNGYGFELIRGGRGGDRFDSYQTGGEQIVLDGAGGSDTYVAHAPNARSGTGATSDVRVFDTGDFWDTDKAVFLGSQADDTVAVDQIAVQTSLGSNAAASSFSYGEPDVVLGFESGATATHELIGVQSLASGKLDRAARLLVTVADGDSTLVVVEPGDVGGTGAAEDLVAALNAALGAAGLGTQLAASAVADPNAGFHVALTAADPTATIAVDNLSQGSGIEALDVHAGGGDDNIAVRGTNPRTAVHVDGELGDDVVTVGGVSVDSPAITLGGIRGSSLTGALVVDGGTGNDALTVTDADDLTARSGKLDERVISGLGMQVDIEYHGLESLGLQLGRGADDFVVGRTPLPVVAVAAGDGDDSVTVQTVAGTLAVAGEAGADTLRLEASVAGSRAALAGGDGADQIDVQTMAGDVEVLGGGGDDTISVGSRAGAVANPDGGPTPFAAGPAAPATTSGDVNLVNGALHVSGGPGLDTLNVDDSADGGDALAAAAPIDGSVAKTGRLHGDARFGLDFGDGEPPVEVEVVADVGVLVAASPVPAAVAANGRLSADAELTLLIGGEQIDVVVKRDAANASIADLLADVNAALDFVGIPAARVEATYDASTGRFSLVSKQAESLEIAVRAGDPASSELGFADGTSAAFDNDGLEDLEADVNDALRRVGVADRVTATIDAGRLSLGLASGDSLLVHVDDGDPAASDLGLADGQLLQPNNVATLAVNPTTARAELTGLGMGPTGDGGPGITFDTIGRVNIRLGSGDDRFDVRGTLNDEAPALQSITTIDMGGGDDVILVSDAAPALEPERGFLDGTLDAIRGELFIAAGDGDNTLEVSDHASTTGDQGVVITASSISGLAPAPIHYSTTGRFSGGITIFAGSGADEIRVESVLAEHVTSLHANAGDDDITIVDAPVVTRFGAAPALVGTQSAIGDGLLLVYGEQGADLLDASGWHQSLVLFGDLGEVDFANADLRPTNMVLAQTIEPQVYADDRLVGGSSNDLLFGGLGADSLAGGAGDDALLGDAGRVTWQAGGVVQVEATELFSGAGDALAGGAMTASSVLGGDGHDVIIGGAGSDVLYGTLAEDIMIFEYGRVTFVAGHATSVIVLGQRPLDLAASVLFDLYLKPPAEAPAYTIPAHEPSVPPTADAVNPVSTGGRALDATHHQRVVRGIVLPDVQFALGSADLTSGADTLLERVSQLLADFPGAVVEIGGHTDSTGAADYNQALSQMRAEAVRNALIERGIDPARLRAVGYGEGRPIADNATEEGRASNRRVELSIVAGAGDDAAASPPPTGVEVLGALGLQGWRSARSARATGTRRRRIDW